MTIESIIDNTALFFGAETPLRMAAAHGGRDYEDRPQQREMALSVAKSLASSENLCVEAPTGIGKSYAYLIPSLYYSLVTNKPVVISTETINLQEQLFKKDIPFIKNLLGIEFKATLALGRSNYLCKRRLQLCNSQERNLYVPSAALRADIKHITDWSMDSIEGIKSSMEFVPDANSWNCVCCEANNCNSDKCHYFKNCYYFNAKTELSEARLIIANHAVFFTDLKMRIKGNGKILPDYCAVVIDEAHQLEDSATRHLGTELADYELFDFLNRLFNPVASRGLLTGNRRSSSKLRRIVASSYDLVKTFFNAYRLLMDKEENSKRIKEVFPTKQLISKLDDLASKLDEYLKLQTDENYVMELNSQLMRCKDFIETLQDRFTGSNGENAYWIELSKRNRRQVSTLNTAPIEVAPILRKHLFSIGIPVILTSATLSIRNDLNFYKQRVGFEGNDLVLTSPFNYSEQVTLYIAENIVNPKDENYESELASYITKYLDKSNGKAFVLFTSYSLMKKMKELTKDFFLQKGIRVIVQGEGLSRSKMLHEFKSDINSVIFGANSFWSGVDVPGEALSNVIITRIPFPVPSEPIVEAKCERIEAHGGNSFKEYILPEAVLQFRQGIGRLIRSRTDKGILVILDNRILRKEYGRIFLESIPPSPKVIDRG